MNFGIDAISFYTSNYYLDLKIFALARHQDVSKFYEGRGQKKMAIAPPNEDIVTLAASATAELLKSKDTSNIEMVLFATETGIDLSKSAGTYIHRLFNLPKRCRVVELKQACFSATFGLQMGLAWLRQNTSKQVLLIASDIAHYEFNSAAESSQGCGAVAMLLSADPRLLVIEPESGFCTEEVIDFWRPNYLGYALVDGRLSCEMYMRFVEETWRQYTEKTGRRFIDHDRFCYHVPLAKLVIRSHKKLARINGVKNLTQDQLEYQIGKSLIYNQEVGNCYTASLYLSIISLLENIPGDISGRLLGLYSYGSGSVGEFFAARVVNGYQKWLKKDYHQTMFAKRQELTFAEYESFYGFKYPNGDDWFELPKWQVGKLRLQALIKHRRLYEKVT
ncbi:MAG: hydroxymethylglutaryl-CoA synthase [Coxiellaceae bacterium]|jgi:hydroxymethylglutaryl-CoA synthase|nr:hydroxymethylglutaryl-CoA synthase [Coxiellaceae bacterium]